MGLLFSLLLLTLTHVECLDKRAKENEYEEISLTAAD